MNENVYYAYGDMFDMPHHVSESRKPMSMHDRAAQFSAFAALTGYDDEVEETARLTEARPALSEDKRDDIDKKLQILSEHLAERPEISVTFFVPDERKSGGAFSAYTGELRHIDYYNGYLIFTDGEKISLWDIFDIDGEIYNLIERE